MSLLTTSSRDSHIAEVNITSDSLFGLWSVSVNVSSRFGAYTVFVYGMSDLFLTADIFEVDSSNIYGFSKINGKALPGS